MPRIYAQFFFRTKEKVRTSLDNSVVLDVWE